MRRTCRTSRGWLFFSPCWASTCWATGCATRWTRACADEGRTMSEVPDNRLTLVFPPLPYFALARARTALVVVDMQKLDAHPDFGIGAKAKAAGIGHIFDYYWPAVRCALGNQQRLLKAARAAGVTVIYTRIMTQTHDARDAGNQHRYVGIAVAKDSVDAEIMPEIAPMAGDIVIAKTSS